MPYKFEPRPEVLWPVTIETPADGGTCVKHHVKIRYRLKKQVDVDAILEQGDDKHLLREVIAGWQDVLDDNDKPVEFGAEALEEALGFAFVRRALVDGFFRANAGAPAKN